MSTAASTHMKPELYNYNEWKLEHSHLSHGVGAPSALDFFVASTN